MNAATAPRVRTKAGVLQFLTHEQMAEEIIRLDAALAATRSPAASPAEPVGFDAKALYLIGYNLNRYEWTDEDLDKMARKLIDMSGICTNCHGDGVDGEQDGDRTLIWACTDCNGSGSLATPEREELDRLRALINNPQTAEFLPAVQAEAAHQRQKWGEPHDRQKSAENWFWLVGYLSGKALRAAITGDTFKARHHTISSAAALCNWFEAIARDESGAGLGVDADIKPISDGGGEGQAPLASEQAPPSAGNSGSGA